MKTGSQIAKETVDAAVKHLRDLHERGFSVDIIVEIALAGEKPHGSEYEPEHREWVKRHLYMSGRS